MITSKVEFNNGRAELYVNGVRQTPMAYITYFDERSCCEDFAKAGYEIFSLCASFSGLPLNPNTGFSPLYGIFDIKDKPDYSRFDQNVRKIVSCCKNAKIFPRVRISMPKWWVDENPDEICPSKDGNMREALFSKKYREDGAKLLKEFIAHVHESDYCDNIIGYQLAGGGTEEWFHFDRNGSLCKNSKKYFDEYSGGIYSHLPLPDHKVFEHDGFIKNTYLQKYLEFVSFDVANTVAYFAHVAKECVNHTQVIGAFYGYSQIMYKAFGGCIGLSQLLDCPDIDFFCSPVAYTDSRATGIDWAEQITGDSLKRHKKLYFIENDIRTYLSDYPENCRKGVDPQMKYTAKVWLGPATQEMSVWAIRKAFARQYTHANAMWWFDMWGGWYKDKTLMRELEEYRKMMEKFTESDKITTKSQVAVLFDEKLPFRLGTQNKLVTIQMSVSEALGSTGIPFDTFITEDYSATKDYDLVLFAFPQECDTDETDTIKRFLKENKIPYAQVEKDGINPTVLREMMTVHGIHCYCDTNDVIYCGNGMLAIHAASEGKKIIALPDGRIFEAECEQYETKIFSI